MSSTPLVYLETSFISHLTARPSADPLHAAKQYSSRKWWDSYRGNFILVVSSTVFEECRAGESGMAQKRLEIAQTASLLKGNPAILEVAKLLLEPNGPLPRKAAADALHIANAGLYGCHFLLTWNFKHIANALIKRRVEGILKTMATNHLQSVPQTNSWHEDEVVEELHRHRAAIADRFDGDVERMYEYYLSVPIDPKTPCAEIEPVIPERVAG